MGRDDVAHVQERGAPHLTLLALALAPKNVLETQTNTKTTLTQKRQELDFRTYSGNGNGITPVIA